MARAAFSPRKGVIPRKYRLWSTGILCLSSLIFLGVRVAVDEADIFVAIALAYAVAAYFCWRGSSLGFNLVVTLAFLALFTEGVVFFLNVSGFWDPAVSITALIVFGSLQLTLAYLGMRYYNGQVRWPALLIVVGFLFVLHSYIGNTYSCFVGAAVDISNPRVTTLSEILSGRFYSSLDKYGANGTVVRVDNLTVLQVFGAFDGDSHIVVSQGTISPFITEVLPCDQARLHSPVRGTQISITGVVYWDDAHVSEAWHGYTGWEIHPVLAWSVSQ